MLRTAWTPRERQVIQLLVDGLDTRAVTRALLISQHTVQDHLKSIFARSGVHSRRQLVAMFTGAVAGIVRR